MATAYLCSQLSGNYDLNSRRDLKPKPAPAPAPEPEKKVPRKPTHDELVDEEIAKRDKRLAHYRKLHEERKIDDDALQQFEDDIQEEFRSHVNKLRKDGR